MDHLDMLEYKSVHILREAYSELGNLCMLWSIGRDSTGGEEGFFRSCADSACSHRYAFQNTGND